MNQRIGFHASAVVAGAMACAAFPLATFGQTELAKVIASDPAAGDNYGKSVAIDDGTAIVGAWDKAGGGAAYVLVQSGSTWFQQAKLLASDRASGDEFGVSVAVSGDWAVVGAWSDTDTSIKSGSAYVFHRTGSSWTQFQKLLQPAGDRAASDGFGIAVAMEGDVMVIGADRGPAPGFADAGAAYVFRFNGSAWAFEQRLNAGDPATLDAFGSAVAISGSTIVVGSKQDDDAGSNSGSAYVFVYSGSSWSQQAKLTASDAAAGDAFGSAVSINGDSIVIGAPFDDAVAFDSGSACVFQRTGFAWSQQAKLTNPFGDTSYNFGNSVSIDGSTIAVGEYNFAGDVTGDVHIFRFSGGTWNEDAFNITASDGNSNKAFSRDALALSDDQTLIVGSQGDFDFGLGSGAVYFYSVGSAAPPDCDGDGLTDDEEAMLGTDPCNFDSDGDSLSDFDEVNVYFTNPLAADTDNDGLSDADEIFVYSTNPVVADTDNDGLSDGAEILTYNTDPFVADTDHDGVLDGTEVEMAMGSGCPDPLIPDSDGDTLSDGYEVDHGTNPCNADTDGDGISDNIDPTPTVPGVPANFLETMTRDAEHDILALDLSRFDAPNNNAKKGRRNSLANRAADAANAIAAGHSADALEALNSILDKIDGQSAPPDWMPPSADKTALYNDVQLLITLVQLLQ